MSLANYITPAGARRLSEELERLLRVERPQVVEQVAEAAAQGDRSENAEYKYGKLRLREIDRRIRFLQKRLDRAVLVDPSKQHGDAVRFGAHVAVEDEQGERRCYQIVGEDESEPAAGKLSWCSPLGRALLGRKVGDAVAVRRPAGEIEVEIVAIRYEAGDPGP